jgi:hypothetical protein
VTESASLASSSLATSFFSFSSVAAHMATTTLAEEECLRLERRNPSPRVRKWSPVAGKSRLKEEEEDSPLEFMQILQHKLPLLAIAINCAIVFKASESALQKYVCFLLFLCSPQAFLVLFFFFWFLLSLSCLFSSFSFLHHRLNQLSTSSFLPSFLPSYLINLQFLFLFFASISFVFCPTRS